MTVASSMRTKSMEPDILIFAGTTEGRELAEYASEIGAACYVSTATEYGKEILGERPGVRVLSGRMDEGQIAVFRPFRTEELLSHIHCPPLQCALQIRTST